MKVLFYIIPLAVFWWCFYIGFEYLVEFYWYSIPLIFTLWLIWVASFVIAGYLAGDIVNSNE